VIAERFVIRRYSKVLPQQLIFQLVRQYLAFCVSGGFSEMSVTKKLREDAHAAASKHPRNE